MSYNSQYRRTPLRILNVTLYGTFLVALRILLLCFPILYVPNAVVVHASSEAAGKETLVGLVGKDFVLLMADSSVSQSFALTASNVDKIATISDPFPNNDCNVETTTTTTTTIQTPLRRRQMAIAAAAAGDMADSDRLLNMLKAYATIEEYQNGWGCDVIIRRVMATDNSIIASSPTQIIMGMPGLLDVKAMAHFARRLIAKSLRSPPSYQVCLLIAGIQFIEEDRVSSTDYEEEKPNNHKPYYDTNSAKFQTNNGKGATSSQVLQGQIQQAWGKSNPTNEPEEDTLEGSTSPRQSVTTGCYEPRLYWLDEYGSLQRVPYGAHGLASNFVLSILDRGYRPDMTLEEAKALMTECFRQLRHRYVINSPRQPCIKCIDVQGIHLIQHHNKLDEDLLHNPSIVDTSTNEELPPNY